MSPSLPPSLIAKLSPTCRWRGCSRDKTLDADWCAEHHERMKGYWRRSAEKRLRARRKARECRDCTAGLPRGWRSTRCHRCQRAQTASAKRRRIRDEARRIRDAEPERGHVAVEQRTDGRAPTERYVGRSRRGAPSLDDRARDMLIDIGEARRLLEAFSVAFMRARTEGVFALSRVLRDQALALVAEPGARSVRMLSAVVLALDARADVDAAEDFDPEG